MNYEEYVDILENLKFSNNQLDKEKILKSSINPSLIPMLEPKIIELIKTKYQNAVNKMVDNLENIFSDQYYLDQYLVNFKKEVMFIYDLTGIKELKEDKKIMMQKMIKDETRNVYNILEQKANTLDLTGSLSMTIKNNEIKWGE